MFAKRICLLVNPYAALGKTLQILHNVERELKRLKQDFYTALTEDVPAMQKIALQASQNGEHVYVLGGDGTLRCVAQVLRYTQAALGVIPCGRGNDFARILSIPFDPILACQQLVNGKEMLIDLGDVNDKAFLTICSLGFDSVANEIALNTRFIRGAGVYAYAGLRALLRWSPLRFSVQIDGKSFEHKGYTVAVANSKCYGGGMFLAPEASLTDGLLDVILIGDISKIRLLYNFPRVFRGSHVNAKGFKVLQGKNIMINTEPHYSIYADGDFISPPPANIRVLPKALKILVPRDFILQ